jgi:hypothetical protein
MCNKQVPSVFVNQSKHQHFKYLLKALCSLGFDAPTLSSSLELIKMVTKNAAFSKENSK